MLWDKSSRRLEKLVQMIPRKAGRQEIRWKDARKGRLRALIFNTFIIFCPLCTMYMQYSQISNYTLTNLYLILPRYLQWHLASPLPSTPKCRAQCWETHPWSTKLWAQDRLQDDTGEYFTVKSAAFQKKGESSLFVQVRTTHQIPECYAEIIRQEY